MSEPQETYIVAARTSHQFEVWAKCGTATCGLYHGPMATSDKQGDAERIARALNGGGGPTE